jgi:hypothetical protein
LSQATKQALEQTGIRIDTSSTSLVESSRSAALQAIELFLQQEQVTEFSQTFDSLQQAAQSDPTLQAAFASIQEKTSEWQQATGRLAQTRSANLFMEGATRLHARAAAIFQNQSWGGDVVSSALLKSFTEGDAALARLKSVELGDVIKSRLVEAIEVRSEAHGGLDGIIAGALTTINGSGKNQLQSVLTDLQQKASAATMNAHETLISVLSVRANRVLVVILSATLSHS